MGAGVGGGVTVTVFVAVGVGAGAVLVVLAGLVLMAAPLQPDKTMMSKSAAVFLASFMIPPIVMQ